MNPYQILGIPPGCTDADVEQAYRRIASNPLPATEDKQEYLRCVRAAYERLRTEPGRRIYDQQAAMRRHIVAEFFSNCIPRMEARR